MATDGECGNPLFVICRRESFSTLKSSSILVKEGPSLPPRRSHITVRKPVAVSEQRELCHMDWEEESATEPTFDDYSLGERS